MSEKKGKGKKKDQEQAENATGTESAPSPSPQPKAAKSKGKGKKPKKEIDWAAPENFDKNRSMIYIEHTTECPIFALKADEFHKYVMQKVPDRIFQLIRNKNGKPRPGSFEIQFSQNARTSLHNLWSGIEKGPPRKDKFPETYDVLMPEVEKVLKKFYPDVRPESIALPFPTDDTQPEEQYE